MPRQLENWIKSYMQYVEETETPRDFWFWGALFTITSAFQRKVWVPYGLQNVYPNLYLLIVGPPASRKGASPTLSKRLLEDISIEVSADSSSKRALTEALAEISGGQVFPYNGKNLAQSSMAIISKEMSSLLAVNPKEMVEVLTDLYDSHDVWKYQTSGKGHDHLYGVCVGSFIATTPSWINENLPTGSIGGGFTSRYVVVYGSEKYKRVPFPPAPDDTLYQALVHDLTTISTFIGPFSWEVSAHRCFENWYNGLDQKVRRMKDERFHYFMERMHFPVIKVAMALRAAYSNELTITLNDIEAAIELTEKTLIDAPKAFGGYGKSAMGPIIEKLTLQLRQVKEATFGELLSWNYRDVDNGSQLKSYLYSMQEMGQVEMKVNKDSKEIWKWKL